MPLFRPQRGSLDESMAEAIFVNNRMDLLTQLKLYYKETAPVAIVSVEAYPEPSKEPHYDGRIGWQTYLVTAKWLDDVVGVLGFTNGPLS